MAFNAGEMKWVWGDPLSVSMWKSLVSEVVTQKGLSFFYRSGWNRWNHLDLNIMDKNWINVCIGD